MPRFKLTLEYDGTPFVGWQRQTNGPSVQAVLEDALSAVEEQPTKVQGAGRTDTGVHATGQCASVECHKNWRVDRLRDAINAHMRPHPVSVLAVEAVDDAFDARFSALARHYLYRIINRRAPLALEANRAWLVKRRLDSAAMHQAAQRLVGQFDFSTFRDSQCQANSPVRTLEQFDVSQTGELIEIRLKAQSFLHRQVRSMVGSLEHVGSGRWRAQDLESALHARDRTRCGTVAPAAGLYLVKVDYPSTG